MLRAEAERLAQWRDRVEQWRGSGLSQSAFARKYEVSKSQLNYWVNRFKASEVPPQLVPIRVSADVTTRPPEALIPALTLRSPSGWSLSIPPSSTGRWLGELLQSLP